MDAQDPELMGVRHVQIRVTDEVFAAIKQKSGNGQGALQRFVRDATLRALDPAGEPPYPYRKENRELHEKLEKILNSGDAGVINAVIPNIEVFFERRRKGAEKPRSGGKAPVAELKANRA